MHDMLSNRNTVMQCNHAIFSVLNKFKEISWRQTLIEISITSCAEFIRASSCPWSCVFYLG
jgi:hypothetical protein